MTGVRIGVGAIVAANLPIDGAVNVVMIVAVIVAVIVAACIDLESDSHPPGVACDIEGMNALSAQVTQSTARLARDVVHDLLSPLSRTPKACVAAAIVDVDVPALARQLHERLPNTAMVGTSSCRSVSTHAGALQSAASLFFDGDGVVAGAASSAIVGAQDAAATGVALLEQAMRRANLSAQEVDVVVVHATPGREEALLAGLSSVLRDETMVVGGSGADNDLTGKWTVFGPDGAFSDGAAVLVLRWPAKIAVSYQGGYLATEHEGKVTAADGRRLISIDGRPAVEVYEGWLGRRLPRHQSLLAETTLAPLGIAHGVGGGLDVHVLVHPELALADGSLQCFAPFKVGERVLMMEASISSLIRRGGLVSKFALQQQRIEREDVVGGLLIYCAGCSLALGDDVVPMTDGVQKALEGVPFLMPFTYGEQGRLRRNRIDHGNLMLSALFFTRTPR